jgi:hypothetical protein
MNSTGLKTSAFVRPSTAPSREGTLELLRGMTRQQLLLRGGIVLAAVCGIAVTEAAGDLAGAGVAVVAIAAAAAVARPDSHAAVIAIVAFAVHWNAGVDDVGTPWAVAAAACVLAMHTCAALAALAPPTATMPRELLRRWGARAGVVTAVTAATWTAAFALEDVATPANVGLAAAGALALLGLIRLMWPHQS